ncbi:MAG: hypothetical protein KBH14_00895 [Vicinamibacteria bacterium]|jgi:hypothetical protein|nr:hypothetical protein [Vicinamibacteria bacterium]MBP9944934.1 hypothetical protein [Vicinamibacteria bacterium]
MTETRDHIHEWMADWQEETTALRPSPAEEIRVHVKRRERLLIGWLAGDVVVGVGCSTLLLHRAVTHPDPAERLAMGLLFLAVLAICVFEGYNWRGALGSSAETTATHLTLALDRSRRLQRSLQAGWPLLAAEVAVFLPWTWYQLYGNGGVPAAERSVFAWGLLVAMTAIGALALVLAQRWAARDAADLESLRSELMDGDAESSSPTEP